MRSCGDRHLEHFSLIFFLIALKIFGHFAFIWQLTQGQEALKDRGEFDVKQRWEIKRRMLYCYVCAIETFNMHDTFYFIGGRLYVAPHKPHSLKREGGKWICVHDQGSHLDHFYFVLDHLHVRWGAVARRHNLLSRYLGSYHCLGNRKKQGLGSCK